MDTLNIIECFSERIKDIGAQTANICQQKQRLSRTSNAQITSLYEKYGLYVHPQLNLLIIDVYAATLNKKELAKTNLILTSIINDEEFQKAPFYWAEVHRHAKYRFYKDLYDNIAELRTVTRKPLEMRLTEMQPIWRLIFLCLGWLIWIQGAIPSVKMFGGGHGNHPYWHEARYFDQFARSLNDHIRLLQEAMRTDLRDETPNPKWLEAIANETTKSLEEYDKSIFFSIIGY
ncbi:MAG: hypothetical protein WC456_03115 [Patescibacteria group bacterium]